MEKSNEIPKEAERLVKEKEAIYKSMIQVINQKMSKSKISLVRPNGVWNEEVFAEYIWMLLDGSKEVFVGTYKELEGYLLGRLLVIKEKG